MRIRLEFDIDDNDLQAYNKLIPSASVYAEIHTMKGAIRLSNELKQPYSIFEGHNAKLSVVSD